MKNKVESFSRIFLDAAEQESFLAAQEPTPESTFSSTSDHPYSDFTVSSDTAHYLQRVLRIKPGQKIEVVLGDARVFLCQLAIAKEKRLKLSVCSRIETIEPTFSVSLIMAVCKHDKNELIAQKAVELNVSTIYFYQSDRSVAELSENKLERLNKIVKSAAEQSKQNQLPQVIYLKSKDQLLSILQSQQSRTKLIASLEAHTASMAENIAGMEPQYLVAVGPEGDFTAGEYQLFKDQGFRSTGLSVAVLRSETAAIAVLAGLNIKHFGQSR